MVTFAITQGIEDLVENIQGSGLMGDENLRLFATLLLRSFYGSSITTTEFMTSADTALRILPDPSSRYVERMLRPENMIISDRFLSQLKTGEFTSITQRGKGFYAFLHNHIPEIAEALFPKEFYEEIMALYRPIIYTYRNKGF